MCFTHSSLIGVHLLNVELLQLLTPASVHPNLLEQFLSPYTAKKSCVCIACLVNWFSVNFDRDKKYILSYRRDRQLCSYIWSILIKTPWKWNIESVVAITVRSFVICYKLILFRQFSYEIFFFHISRTSLKVPKVYLLAKQRT